MANGQAMEENINRKVPEGLANYKSKDEEFDIHAEEKWSRPWMSSTTKTKRSKYFRPH